MDHATDQAGTSWTRWAWIIVALLWPVALLNYLDRQMLAAMKSSMSADIADLSTQANWGLVLGSFKWVYALLSPLAGYLGDKTSRWKVITVSLAVWSLATWLTSYVTSLDQLLLTRALMGVSEAFYIPIALALITDFHPGSTRSRAVGIHQTAIYAGTILGGFTGYVADAPDFGWRWVFSACGLLGIVYAVPLYFLLREPPGTQTQRQSLSLPRTLRELLGNPNFVLLVLYFTLPALAGWVIRDWMPAILQSKFDLSQGKAGVSAVLYVQVASLVGALIGGYYADRWMRRSERGRIYVSALGMSLFLPALFGVGNAATLFAAICFLVLFGLGWGFFDCNNMPILCQIARPELRATGYGLMNMVSISCGGFADWGFGILRDRGVPLNWIFGVFAGIALLSLGIVLMIRPQAAAVDASTS